MFLKSMKLTEIESPKSGKKFEFQIGYERKNQRATTTSWKYNTSK